MVIASDSRSIILFLGKTLYFYSGPDICTQNGSSCLEEHYFEFALLAFSGCKVAQHVNLWNFCNKIYCHLSTNVGGAVMQYACSKGIA